MFWRSRSQSSAWNWINSDMLLFESQTFHFYRISFYLPGVFVRRPESPTRRSCRTTWWAACLSACPSVSLHLTSESSAPSGGERSSCCCVFWQGATLTLWSSCGRSRGGLYGEWQGVICTGETNSQVQVGGHSRHKHQLLPAIISVLPVILLTAVFVFRVQILTFSKPFSTFSKFSKLTCRFY